MHDSTSDRTVRIALSELATAYDVERTRVDAAYRRMRDIAAARHAPADARVVATDLTTALRQATATANRVLHLLEPVSPPRRRLHRRRRVTRPVPIDVAVWSAELVRLAQIGVWLRRTTLDDLGVHVPTAVRVGSRAATGPHIAGMVADRADHVAATLQAPRIGVDLQAIVDTGGGGRAPSVASAPLTTAGPATRKAA